MKEEKQALVNYLKRKFDELVLDHVQALRFAQDVWELHKIPVGFTSDAVAEKKELSTLSNFDLFCYLQELVKLDMAPESKIEKYFTPEEIKFFDTAEFESVKENLFPIRIKAIEINEDQWIGKITAKELMKWRDNQLVDYNTNAQRAMTRVIRGGVERYKITLNKKAVDSIKEKLQNGEFIPNTLTFNIPDDLDDTRFYYDSTTDELVIDHVDHLDISDGYHRYVAICKTYDKDPSFDFSLEVRFIAFPEGKVKRFIYQEDQKTKMTRVASDALDTSSVANQVTERINNDTESILQGLIRRDSVSWNYTDVNTVINALYGKSVKGDLAEKRIETRRISREMIKFLNEFLEEYPEYLQKGTLLNIAIILDGFKLAESEGNIDVKKIAHALEAGQQIKVTKNNTGRIRRRTWNEIDSLFK